MSDEFRDLMLVQPCDYCGAEPGYPCQTRGGHLYAPLHAARWYAAQAIRRGQGQDHAEP